MKRASIRTVLAGALLAALLCLLAGCRAFPHLTQALGGELPAITLAISLDPDAPEESAVSWSPASAPIDSAAVTEASGDPSPTLTVTVRLRPGW